MLKKSMNYVHLRILHAGKSWKGTQYIYRVHLRLLKIRLALFQCLICGLLEGTDFFDFLKIKSFIYNQNSNHFTSELNSGGGPKDSESQYKSIR